MDDLQVIKDITTWIGGIGATGMLVFIVYRLESGKWKTEASHKEVVEEIKKSEQRAWDMVTDLTNARTADNVIYEKFADSIGGLREAVNSLRSAIENQRNRR